MKIRLPQLDPPQVRFRAKVSPYLGKLIKQSPAIAKQFLPDSEENISYGTDAPFEEGRNHHGIYGLERIYADRAVITPYFECSAYCRYCFKKTRTLAGNAKRMSEENIAAAVHYIASDARMNTVLITGGDPFMDPLLLKQVLDCVIDIPHINFIRIGTRNILFAPQTISDEFADTLANYNRFDALNLGAAKSISISFSLNHPDELTTEVVQAARKFIDRGIVLRGQIALLKGVNDNPATLKKLLHGFLCIGIVPYYLLHCMPVSGSRHFRTTVQRGLDILEWLLPSSGILAPLYVYVSPVGKIRLSPGTPLEYDVIDGQRYVKTITPYKASDFFEFSGKTALPPLHDVDERGFIMSRYLDGEE